MHIIMHYYYLFWPFIRTNNACFSLKNKKNSVFLSGGQLLFWRYYNAYAGWHGWSKIMVLLPLLLKSILWMKSEPFHNLCLVSLQSAVYNLYFIYMFYTRHPYFSSALFLCTLLVPIIMIQFKWWWKQKDTS